MTTYNNTIKINVKFISLIHMCRCNWKLQLLFFLKKIDPLSVVALAPKSQHSRGYCRRIARSLSLHGELKARLSCIAKLFQNQRKKGINKK